jgi:hypothetical protein
MTPPPSRLRPEHPPSRLRPGHLLPPSSAILLFLPPPVAPILTGSTALLLSSGEWGEMRFLALLVALPPPMLGFTPHDLRSARVSLPIMTGSTALLLSSGEWGEMRFLALSVALPPPMLGFTPHDLRSARVSLLPPRLSIIARYTSQVPLTRRFLRSSLAMTIIPHLLGGFVMPLLLVRNIIMRLHLWRLRLRLLFRRCVLCLKMISLLLRRRTLPRLSWFHRPLLHLLMATTMVWILVSLWVLPINQTHPFPFTRPAFTSPWCRLLPVSLLYLLPPLPPHPVSSFRAVFSQLSVVWLLLPSLRIPLLVWPSPTLVPPTTCSLTSRPSSLTSAFQIFKCVWGIIPTSRSWAVVQS